MEPNKFTRLLFRVVRILHAELEGNLQLRNVLARGLFDSSCFPRFVEKPGSGERVETWWDDSTSSWVTQVGLDQSDYNGNRSDAAVSHFWALSEFLVSKPKKLSKDSETYVALGQDALQHLRLELPEELMACFLRSIPSPYQFTILRDRREDHGEAMNGEEWLRDNAAI